MRPSGTEPSREPALDAVRGIAALVVVFHHGLLPIPALANAYQGSGRTVGWAWWLTNTPLHLLWADPEAVYVFFLLSGFVLYRGTERDTAGWLSYYVSRLIRLYVPVFGAVAFAAVCAAVVPRIVDPHASWWLNDHALIGNSNGIAGDALLLGGTDWLNSSLWTLQWEVVCSLLLPWYAFFGASGRNWWPVKLLGMAGVVFLGLLWQVPFLAYLPMFALGTVLAADREQIGRMLARVPSPVLWVGTALALCARWLVAIAGPPTPVVAAAATTVEVLGGMLLLMLALRNPWWSRGRSVQWLGSRSFSLYLVHEPLAVSAALLLGAGQVGWTLLITVPLALLVAELYYRVLEHPSHQLARRAGSATRPTARLLDRLLAAAED